MKGETSRYLHPVALRSCRCTGLSGIPRQPRSDLLAKSFDGAQGGPLEKNLPTLKQSTTVSSSCPGEAVVKHGRGSEMHPDAT